jgi:hypothetical protein
MEVMPAQQFDRSTDNLMGRLTSVAGGDSSGVVGDWPLKLVAVDTENVKVLLGTVNGIIPTDVNTPLDISGADDTWYIYLHASLGADGIPTAVAVESLDGGPVPPDDDDNAYLLIGLAVVASAVITSVSPSLAWPQTFVACGRDPDDPATTPGTYYWTVA